MMFQVGQLITGWQKISPCTLPQNMNIIYWNSELNERGSRIFLVTILRAPATIKLKGNQGKKNSNLTKFGANLIFSPRLRPMYYFSYFFRNLAPVMTKQRILVLRFPYFATVQINWWKPLVTSVYYGRYYVRSPFAGQSDRPQVRPPRPREIRTRAPEQNLLHTVSAASV